MSRYPKTKAKRRIIDIPSPKNKTTSFQVVPEMEKVVESIHPVMVKIIVLTEKIRKQYHHPKNIEQVVKDFRHYLFKEIEDRLVSNFLDGLTDEDKDNLVKSLQSG